MKDKRSDRERLGRSGFTLVEVLLVVAIIGVLAGIVAVRFGGQGKGARIKATRASIAAVCTAIDMYEVSTGRYPPSLQSLITSDGAANWEGPYLVGDSLPADSWGTPLGYAQQGDTGYKVTSAGPDLAMGTGDDITSY